MQYATVSNPFVEQGRWMMVSDDQHVWLRRFVFMEKCGKFLAWDCAMTYEEVAKTTLVNSWAFAKEEEEPKELSLEERVAKLELTFKELKK